MDRANLPKSHLIAATALIGLLTACGGGGGGGPGTPTPPPTTSPPPPPPPTVGKVEIEQTGLLFTSTGQTRQLQARVLDTNGNPMTATITWVSKTAGNASGAHIEINSAGLATAASNGVAQIVASAGDIESAPLVAAVTPVPSGAILLTDANIVGEPVPTDTSAPPDPGSNYDITLTGIAAPTIGAIVVNTESKIVAGRVVAVAPVNTDTKVTLALLPVGELFPELELDEVIDLSKRDIDFEKELSDEYDITRAGDTYTFEAKDSVLKVGAAARPKKRVCTGENSSELSLTLPPAFSLKFAPKLDAKRRGLLGLERFVIEVEPEFTAQLGIAISGSVSTGFNCTWYFGILRPVIAGPLAFVIGVQFPFGLELDASAKLAATPFSLNAKLNISNYARFGLTCTEGSSCEVVNESQGMKVNFEPEAQLGVATVRLEPSVAISFFIRTRAGLLITSDWGQFEPFVLRGGVKIAGSFSSTDMQIADPKYKSDYGISAMVNLTAGAGLKKWTEKYFGELEFGVSGEIFSIETPIGKSPYGLIGASRPTFLAGESVVFDVELESVGLISALDAPYMISRVLLIRKEGNAGVVVASVPAAQGQKDFTITYVPDRPGNSSEYFVFVVTRFLPFDELALEIGRAAANLLEIYKVRVICTAPAPYTETGPGFTQVRNYESSICASGAGSGRYFQACRYNGNWMAKQESRTDINFNTRRRFAGEYERDSMILTAQGEFETQYQFGWNQVTETNTHTLINYYEYSAHARANPATGESGGNFYRKIDRTTVSKIPNQTGTYNVTVTHGTLPFGNHQAAPSFTGWSSWDPVGPLPQLVETRGVVDESEIPPECTGPTPYESPY